MYASFCPLQVESELTTTAATHQRKATTLRPTHLGAGFEEGQAELVGQRLPLGHGHLPLGLVDVALVADEDLRAPHRRSADAQGRGNTSHRRRLKEIQWGFQYIGGHQHHDVFHGILDRASCNFPPKLAHTGSLKFNRVSHLLHRLRRVLLDRADPVAHVVERRLVRHVVHQYDAHGASVVRCAPTAPCATPFS
jgi:hypothetical protein